MQMLGLANRPGVAGSSLVGNYEVRSREILVG